MPDNVVLGHNRRTVVCTNYDSVPGIEEAAVTALSLFNDVIIAEASANAMPIDHLPLAIEEPNALFR